jgi:hypothetical protein
MKQLISKKRGLVAVAALMMMVAPGVAYARDGAAEEVRDTRTSEMQTTTDDSSTVKTEQGDDSHQSGKTRAQMAQEKARERAGTAKARLQDAQLKRCEAKQKAITNIMARISDRGQKQLDLFTTIAGRVQTFYTEKGRTLDNYDALVADVEAKREAAQAVVDEIKDADTTFDCSGENPKGVVEGFKTSLKEEIAALKEYKTAVRNLIVGVKSAQSTQTTESTSGGAE